MPQQMELAYVGTIRKGVRRKGLRSIALKEGLPPRQRGHGVVLQNAQARASLGRQVQVAQRDEAGDPQAHRAVQRYEACALISKTSVVQENMNAKIHKCSFLGVHKARNRPTPLSLLTWRSVQLVHFALTGLHVSKESPDDPSAISFSTNHLPTSNC